MGNDRRPRWLLAGLAGGLAGLSLPPLGWPWLLWPCLAVLWGLVGHPRGRGWAIGLLWGTAAVLLSHRWLPALHPLDWIGVPSALSLPLCLALWGLCALAGGCLVALWAALAHRLDPARLSTALVCAGLWGLAEVALARGPLFWIGLGAAPLPGDPPLAGLGAWVGAGGLAAAQVLLGWALWRLALARTWAWTLALLAGLALLHGAGATARALQASGPNLAPERVLVVQTAIPTRQKFLPAQQERLRGLVAAALAQARASGATVVLPEGSLPLDEALPAAAPVEVLGGGFRREALAVRSALLRYAPMATLPTSWVDKHRVVPLGEWVPLGSLLRWSGLSAVGGLEAGSPSRLLLRPGGAIGIAICYEISDGRALARASREGARWLLASANLDPYPRSLQSQFLALAQLRALESGRWLVSAANTGPSALVDPAGRVAAQLPAGARRNGLFAVPSRSGLTPYLVAGEAPLLALVAVGGGLRLSGR
ncbi:MAG: nitrilase-related carbon-nitrogen hydrolase [Cyanobacteriota bacterium]|nr:nitrilase-related carbon-nitrogen hydrolase [Cyanobacteriota bacterium]